MIHETKTPQSRDNGKPKRFPSPAFGAPAQKKSLQTAARRLTMRSEIQRFDVVEMWRLADGGFEQSRSR